MSASVRILLAVSAAAIASPAKADDEDARAPLRTTQQCIDKEIANRLAVKRQRRGAVDRLFIKHARHELSATGGYYVSDMFSSTYVLGGSYTYHMTETTAVELGAALTHADADVIRAVEDGRGTVLRDEFAPVYFAESLLVWSPMYGKLRLGGSIARYDVHLDLGVGVVDSPTSRGASGVSGLGWKLLFWEAFAFRLDARSRVYQQELLEESFIVNDLSLTAGLSLFLPTRN